MERNEIVDKLTAIFREVFSDDALVLNEEMTSNDVENWNSMSHTTMIVEVQDAFNIKFKLKDLNKLKSVGDLIETISSKLN